LVQTGHAIAEFAYKHPQLFSHWTTTSNYLISKAVQDEENLNRLYEKLKWRGADVVAFYEPDISNQMTAICFYSTPEIRKITNKYKLALS
jgi:hypothetical protein